MRVCTFVLNFAAASALHNVYITNDDGQQGGHPQAGNGSCRLYEQAHTIAVPVTPVFPQSRCHRSTHRPTKRLWRHPYTGIETQHASSWGTCVILHKGKGIHVYGYTSLKQCANCCSVRHGAFQSMSCQAEFHAVVSRVGVQIQSALANFNTIDTTTPTTATAATAASLLTSWMISE